MVISAFAIDETLTVIARASQTSSTTTAWFGTENEHVTTSTLTCCWKVAVLSAFFGMQALTNTVPRKNTEVSTPT